MLVKLHPGFIRVARRVTGIRVKHDALFRAAVEGKVGLEIGGPSGAFGDSGILPLYRHLASLDNCVFAARTTWEGSRPEGQSFFYHRAKPLGFNFIREATDLSGIQNGRYEFVLSAHNLEHVANPVKALKEWKRVLRENGTLVLILPHHLHTFDHRRAPTPIEHMMADFNKNIDERDLTHLSEVLTLHDLKRDPGCSDRNIFQQRCEANFENRCMHHHVFDETNSRDLLASVGFTVLSVELVKPHHIVLLAR